MDKVSGKLTVFFEEPFWVGCLNILGQNPKTMKYMILF